MVSPVFGLRPVRAARSRTWKVPKPTRVTASPSFSALVTAATTASTARLDSALVRSAASATASINSVLFILYNSFGGGFRLRSEEHTSELQSQSNLVCRLLLEKKKKKENKHQIGNCNTCITNDS